MIGTRDRSRRLPADVEAVDVRQAQIEQDKVRGRGLERAFARSDARDVVALAPQPGHERVGNRVLVLDDQDVHMPECRAAPAARHRDLAEPLLRLVGSFADASPRPHLERPSVGAMNKAHVTLFALLVAGATVLGAVAVTRTTGLGRAARHTNDAAIAARTKQLAAYAAKLQKELRSEAAGSTSCPEAGLGGDPGSGAAAAPAAAPRIVYHRPPPVVTVVHTHHGDDGSHESDGGGDGGGDD